MQHLIEGRTVAPVLVSGAVASTDAANYVFAGADKVTSGNFAASTGWVVGTNWAIAAGIATHTAGNTDTLSQIGLVIPGCEHVLTYDVLTTTAGSVTASLGGKDGTTQTADGTYVEFITAGNTRDLVFTPTSAFDGDIDNVVLRTVGPDVLLCTVANDGIEGTDPEFVITVNPDFPAGVPTEASATSFEEICPAERSLDICHHQTRLVRNISVFVNGTLGAAQNLMVRGLAPHAKR